MPFGKQVGTVARKLHWKRGLRAGLAVASAMLVCRMLGRPMGWAALGGFEAVLVDNGGPYRSRLDTIASVLLGGAACGLLGSLILPATVPLGWLVVPVLVTAAVCFAVTYARVASQPIANTSVIILVLYFAGFGSTDRTLGAAVGNVSAYVLGGLWAASLSLFLWPLDPFRPARQEVAGCYELLAAYTSSLHREARVAAEHNGTHIVDAKRQIRAKLESARAAIAATPARAPVRTVRARSLSVLLETADMLFAATVRLTELAETAEQGLREAALDDVTGWLARTERTIADGLRNRPNDYARSFGPEGSHRVEHVLRRSQARAEHRDWRQRDGGDEMRLLLTDEGEAMQNVEIAFDAVRAVWTGVDPGAGRPSRLELVPKKSGEPGWRDALTANWTLDSRMMRHALRMAAVGAVDVLLMRAVHVGHGFWLAMTSIIVLQPYSAGTLRKGLERVGGTVAGGFLAALLTALIHSYAGVIAVITACSVLTLATYAVDYGWYSFFLTPTFVLMSLPHLRDWRYAGVRIFTTALGAGAAVIAMRLLWPQSLRVELRRLLAACAEAQAAYAAAVIRYWSLPEARRPRAERTLLASARRACGLSSQDAEEALDRAMLEPLPVRLKLGGVKALRESGSTPLNDGALAFITYTRRFTQSLTTLAAVGKPDARTLTHLENLAAFLRTTAARLRYDKSPETLKDGERENQAEFPPGEEGLAEQMLSRLERQAGVLARAAQAVIAGNHADSAQAKRSISAGLGRVPR